jgi:hypothetical protein
VEGRSDLAKPRSDLPNHPPIIRMSTRFAENPAPFPDWIAFASADSNDTSSTQPDSSRFSVRSSRASDDQPETLRAFVLCGSDVHGGIERQSLSARWHVGATTKLLSTVGVRELLVR